MGPIGFCKARFYRHLFSQTERWPTDVQGFLQQRGGVKANVGRPGRFAVYRKLRLLVQAALKIIDWLQYPDRNWRTGNVLFSMWIDFQEEL